MRALPLSLILLATIAAADTPKKRTAGDAPAIGLAAAVAKAQSYAKANHIDTAKQYLQSAGFDPVERQWDVVWQLANAKGGRTEIHVPEDGAPTVSYGE